MIKFIKLFIFLTISTSIFLSGITLAYAESTKTGIVNTSVLNLRTHPDTTSKVLKKLPKDKQLSIIESKDGWYKINFEGCTGWVSAKYVSLKASALKAPTLQTAVISASNVNLRSLANTSSKVRYKLKKGEKVSIIQSKGDWFNIKTGNGKTGWVIKTYITPEKNTLSRGESKPEVSSRQQVPEPKKPEKVTINNSVNDTANNSTNDTTSVTINTSSNITSNTSNSTANATHGSNNTEILDTISPNSYISQPDVKTKITGADEIIAFAITLQGVPYVYGGTSTEGFDCSGFTYYVYGKSGIKLERVAASQATQGTEVSKDSLKPGDLVFFDTNRGQSAINHVGIYLGDGKFIHASSGNSTRCVTISDITKGFYAETYMTSRRILNLETTKTV